MLDNVWWLWKNQGSKGIWKMIKRILYLSIFQLHFLLHRFIMWSVQTCYSIMVHGPTTPSSLGSLNPYPRTTESQPTFNRVTSSGPGILNHRPQESIGHIPYPFVITSIKKTDRIDIGFSGQLETTSPLQLVFNYIQFDICRHHCQYQI